MVPVMPVLMVRQAHHEDLLLNSSKEDVLLARQAHQEDLILSLPKDEVRAAMHSS